MSFNATWSPWLWEVWQEAEYFSVWVVIIQSAGKWVWPSFVLVGVIALISARSCNQLCLKYKKAAVLLIF